ncbi:hypothetical protein [Paraburkholderia dilworthii]|uniref:hypothetical protein n=1 Tax=Paraburkholderia dilworthii TaxID=948106 RepID=UPI0012B5CD8F|nr:hypothetical protein [Paraburkholderia dilworthii]
MTTIGDFYSMHHLKMFRFDISAVPKICAIRFVWPAGERIVGSIDSSLHARIT